MPYLGPYRDDEQHFAHDCAECGAETVDEDHDMCPQCETHHEVDRLERLYAATRTT